jgi:hypothetical protein
VLIKSLKSTFFISLFDFDGTDGSVILIGLSLISFFSLLIACCECEFICACALFVALLDAFDLFFIMLDDELISLHAPIDNLSEPHVAAALLLFAFLHSSMSLTISEKRTFFTLLLLLHLLAPLTALLQVFFEQREALAEYRFVRLASAGSVCFWL